MDKYERAGKYTRRIVKAGVCFRCNHALLYMKKEKGRYAAMIVINGHEVMMHKQCAINEIQEIEGIYS